MVSAFRIHNGAVDFKQRYVQTEKFKREREAQRALIGKQVLRIDLLFLVSFQHIEAHEAF